MVFAPARRAFYQGFDRAANRPGGAFALPRANS
jgi:hypothetical protein